MWRGDDGTVVGTVAADSSSRRAARAARSGLSLNLWEPNVGSVATVATTATVPLPARIAHIVNAESLLNDATGLVAFKLAECCHPVPGDRIVGLRVKGEGVQVHAIDCLELASGIDAEKFKQVAEATKHGCPVSGALANNVHIELDAQLVAENVCRPGLEVTGDRIVRASGAGSVGH